MDSFNGSDPQNPSKVINLAVVGLLGQVGLVTLAIILIALFGGLWLDSQFNSRPVFTLICLIVSIPISLFVMLKIVRIGLSKLNLRALSSNQTSNKEDNIGKHS